MCHPPISRRTSLTVLPLILTLFLSAGRTGELAAQSPIPPPPGLDSLVEALSERFRVPGVSVSIVKDGELVLARGYGERRLGSGAPVTPGTLFAIASNTKAFTATALALLVEEGKVEWDAPVVSYLPWFQMYDPWVTREITVRDLLVHRSGLGLGAGDLLWWPPSDYTRGQIARRLRFIEPATSFRSHYAYDNVLYVVAAEVVEAVSGERWEAFVDRRILDAVGMRGSRVNLDATASGEGDVALPHNVMDEELSRVDAFVSDAVNPAGGILSSAADMARWMTVQLDSGRIGEGAGGRGERLFSPATTRELWAPVTPMPVGSPPPEIPHLRRDFQGYALGFRITDYRGVKIVTHTGGLPGYLSRVTLVPEEKLGVAVLTNMMSSEVFEAVTHFVLDHYMDAPDFDYLGAYARLAERGDSALAVYERRTIQARDADSRPSLSLGAYAGTYRDAWYGDVVVERGDGGLVIRFTHTPDLVGNLEHWQHDTFVARWRDLSMFADAFVTFQLEPDGSIDRVKMKPVSPAVDFSFDFQDLELRPVEGGS